MTAQTPVHITVKRPELFKRHYEFSQNGQGLIVVDYGKRWGNHAVIQINDRQWKIKTTGFWKKFIELTAEQSPYTKWHISFRWNYKLSVSLDNRNTWHFKATGFWKRVWAWYDEKENMVIEMRSNQLSKNNRGQVTLHQPPTNDLLLLVALGWYQVIACEENSAAVVTSTA